MADFKSKSEYRGNRADLHDRFQIDGLELTGFDVGADSGAKNTAIPNADYAAAWPLYAAAEVDKPVAAFLVDKPVFAGSGTISLTTAGVAVSENFDTLSNTAGSTTNTTLPTGWFTTETGGGARDNEQYAVDTGGSNTGDTYSYGAPGSTDRALGGLQTGTLIPVIGASFTNTTGQTLTSLLVAFTGEQWRLSTLNRVDRLDFQISFNATDLTTGTWIDINTLDFTAPVTGPATGALDGNLAANRTQISATISSADIPGLSIANGATFWIRFNDLNASGADDGLAIDDFSITGIAAAGSPGSLAINDVTVAEGNSGTTNYTFTVTRTGGSAGAVSATWTLANSTSDNADFTTTPQTGTVSFADGQTSATITVTVAGDTAVENNETFFVNLTDPTGGATITDAQGQGTITNDDVGGPGVLSISDVSLLEGDSGATNFVFTVTRTGGSSGVVGASWESTDASAMGEDMVGGGFPSGTVTFADGETSRTFTIQVRGETFREIDEEFVVFLFNPTGGATISNATATGTILNDDFARLSIGDVTQSEGDAGTTNYTFTITRSDDTTGSVGVTWTLASGTTDNSDFTTTPQTGTVNFASGQTTRTVTITVAGDTQIEGDETFFVNLSNPTNGAIITDGQGQGTITNDDVPPIANVWINEIHYDNAGADANEFVEVAGLAGVDLTGWSIVLYNGNGGASYSTINLSGTLASTTNGFGFLKALAPGIQNGPPDGIALVDNLGRVVQFLSYEGVMTATNGPANGLTSTDIGVSQDNATVGLTLQLTGTGSSYGDFTWTANVANTEGAVNGGQSFLSGTDQGQVNIANASIAEGNSGTTLMTFTVTRAGGFATAASVDYQVVLDGTANAADLAAAAALSGTVNFGIGQTSRTITVEIQGDTTGEFNETFSVVLSNPVGNVVIVDGTAVGTITNDDPVPVAIYQIQGESHTSAFAGQNVTTTGIVTAVDSNGFYLQDASGDGNVRTSDAIFIFTNSAPTVAVGDSISVSGTVAEVRPGNNTANLAITQINSPIVQVLSSGNALPAATMIGTGGRLPPTDVFDDDQFATYDPENDAADFYESLEGMLVTVAAPLVTSPTNSFGETYVVASGGVGATGVNSRGGITIAGNANGFDDYNPERLQLDDDSGIFAGYVPNYTQGDILSNVTGVMSYNFQNYELLVTQAVTITTDVGPLAREITALQGTSNRLSMATYNVENLDPGDGKFSILASDIVLNLRAPDIISLNEIQDADGAGGGSNLSGYVTAQGLIDAIAAIGGPNYVYIEVTPSTPNSTGGEPGGNIRNGFLYNADRVGYVAGSAVAVPGAAFSGSRFPLSAQFTFNGETITAISVHSTSRGGSDPQFGANQPPTNAGEAARVAQSTAIRAYVDSLLSTDPDAYVAVLGDFNAFWFEDSLELIENGIMTNLHRLLGEEERYSYVFEGNAQALDHILLTNNLVSSAVFDAVHINSEQPAGPTRGTDHDPLVATFLMNSAAVAQAGLGSGDEDTAITGTLVATDQNGDTLTYAIVTGPANGNVVLGANGAYTYTPNANFNGTDSFTFRANDGSVDGSIATVSLTVNAVNDSPNDVNLDANTVRENAANGTVVATASAADPDGGSTFTYLMVDPAGGRFAINSTTGQITVANGSLLDFESATSYTVWIRVFDGLGGTYKEGFVINLTDVFDTGTDISLSGNSVPENAANGTVVGTINVVDPGQGVTLDYLMVDPAGGRFTINATTGVITVANGSLLDFESATSHTVWVRVTDSLGNTYKQGFTINVTDVAEMAPANAGLGDDWLFAGGSEWTADSDFAVVATPAFASVDGFGDIGDPQLPRFTGDDMSVVADYWINGLPRLEAVPFIA